MGTGRRLKAHRRDIEVWAVEPEDALHGLEGLKHMASSIVPAIYKPTELDGVIAMPTEEAWEVAEQLSVGEGLLVGHSSGANVAGAVRLARRLASAGRSGVIVTVFPDRADRYFEAPRQTLTGALAVGAPRPERPPAVRITAGALAVMYEHAMREYPRECCGIVFGPRQSDLADVVRPCRNVQDELRERAPLAHGRDAHTAFALGPPDLFALSKSLRGELPGKIVYHSHPDVGAYFSETDQAAAQMDGEPAYPVEHVVLDARPGGVRSAAQFAWDPLVRRYVEVARWVLDAVPVPPPPRLP
jgi:proteasome lid subunit RPN8/RPN11